MVLGQTTGGARTYLAVKHGLRTNLRLGSRSHESVIHTGDVLCALESGGPTRHLAEWRWVPDASEPMRILEGPDLGLLEDPTVLERTLFRVGSMSDRIGLRLESTPIRAARETQRTCTHV